METFIIDGFSKDISRMKDYCIACINNHKLTITTDDIINDVYIWFHENNYPYSFTKFKSVTNNIVYKEKQNPVNSDITLMDIDGFSFRKDSETQNYCKGCNEWMPIDMFYKWSKNYHGRPKYRSYCKKCEINRHKINKQKIKIQYAWMLNRMNMVI